MIDNTAEVMEVVETIDTENNEPEIDTDIEQEIDEVVPVVEPISIADWTELTFEAQLDYLSAMKKCVKKNIRIQAREVAKKQKRIEKLKAQLLALGAEI